MGRKGKLKGSNIWIDDDLISRRKKKKKIEVKRDSMGREKERKENIVKNR